MMRTTIIALLICLLGTAVKAQMPACDKLYMAHADKIYVYDPTLPLSATNPQLSSVRTPGNGSLAICPRLNSTSTTPTFYSVTNNTYWYYYGTAWINTGHSATAPNIAGGGGYLFGLDGPSGRVYRYDGTSEVLITTVPRNCAPYDLIADCDGNWYVLNTEPSAANFLRKYDRSGNLLRSWKLVNPANLSGSGGFGIIGNTIYFDSFAPVGVVKGVINDTSVIIIPNIASASSMPSAEDFATCPSAINLTLKLEVVPELQAVCPGTLVHFKAIGTTGLSSPVYQWRVNGVNMGTNSSTFSYIPSDGDIVTCMLSNSSLCTGTSLVVSPPVQMTVFTSPVMAMVTIHHDADGFCPQRPAYFYATHLYGGVPQWKWLKNGQQVGTNSDHYTDSALVTGDEIQVIMVPDSSCAMKVPVQSNRIKVIIDSQPVIPGININTHPPIFLCEGSMISYFSNETGGGLHPRYAWYKNGALLPGETGPDYTDNSPANGDSVVVQMASSAACPVDSLVESNMMNITVRPVVPTSVAVTASPGTVVGTGQYVTFTAQPQNGGVNPGYLWYRNAMLVPGVNSDTWTTHDLHDGDYINVVMESKAACPSMVFTTSNVLKMSVGTTGIAIHGSETGLSVYPNPATGATVQLKIDVPSLQSGAVELVLVNALGQTVWKDTRQDPGSTTLLPLDEALPGGYYLLQVKKDAVRHTLPLLLKR